MEICTENAIREGDLPPKAKAWHRPLENWNKEPEKGTDAGPNERYDPINDVYIYKKPRRYRTEIELKGITPEISEEYLEKILKKYSEEERQIAPENVPVAIRFHLHYVYPGPKNRAKYANAGYYYPSGVDLFAWAEFLFKGLEGVLYESKDQIVCTGMECMYSALPGLVIESFVLWDMTDKVAYRKK